MFFTVYPGYQSLKIKNEREIFLFLLALVPRGTCQVSHCFQIDDYAKGGGEELFTKMHCVL